MRTPELVGYLRIGLRATFVHPAQLAWRGVRGANRFRENFLPERLVPTSGEDRQRLREASRCIGCGLCDLAASEQRLEVRPSLVPLVFSRSSVELPWSRRAIARLHEAAVEIAVAERACPTGVPLRALTAWLAERLASVDAASRGRP